MIEQGLGPVKPQKTYFRIVEKIIGLVASGQLEYGSTLYTETDLLELLHVSRPTLREALRVLEFLGILTVSPRRGITLNKPEDSQRYLPLIYILMFDKTTNIELFELRRALQIDMVGVAADFGQTEDFMVLAANVEEMKHQINADYATFAQLDYDFHMQVVRCSRNKLNLKLMETLGVLIRSQLRDEIHKNMPVEQREQTLRFHQKICEAVLERRAEDARAQMQEHLKRPYRNLMQTEPIYFNIGDLLNGE